MSAWLQILGGLGILAAGVGYLIAQFRQGSIKSKFDTINLQQSQITALEGKINIQEAQIKKLTSDMDSLRNRNEVLSRDLSDKISILQGKDPASQAMFKAVTDAANAISASGLVDVLKRLDSFLTKQEG